MFPSYLIGEPELARKKRQSIMLACLSPLHNDQQVSRIKVLPSPIFLITQLSIYIYIYIYNGRFLLFVLFIICLKEFPLSAILLHLVVVRQCLWLKKTRLPAAFASGQADPALTSLKDTCRLHRYCNHGQMCSTGEHLQTAAPNVRWWKQQ